LIQLESLASFLKFKGPVGVRYHQYTDSFQQLAPLGEILIRARVAVRWDN